MSKHTPGPWQFEYDFDGPGHVIRMGNAIEHRGKYNVEEIINYEHGLSADEDTSQARAQFRRAEANARLIAAAPDLLGALHEALTLTICRGSCLFPVGGTCSCWRGRAASAIKKATGDLK